MFTGVSVVLLPKGFKLNIQPVIVFLGPILRDAPVASEGAVTSKKDFVILPAAAELLQQSNFINMPPLLNAGNKETLDAENYIDPDTLQAPTFTQFVAGNTPTDVRELIFRPPFPAYPEWEQQHFKTGNVRLKAFVSSEGLVEEVVVTQASGNPEVDAALARYVRKWRFAPSGDAQGQWQRLTLRLNFEAASTLMVNIEKG